MTQDEKSGWYRRARHAFFRALVWIRRNVPPGLRTVLGILLIIGGIFSFLPVLGLWMLPLGIAVVSLDVRLARRWLKHDDED